jgi:hypothetical protein
MLTLLFRPRGYTSARSTKLDNLDASILSRNSTTHFDSVIGTPVGLSISADIAEIEAETDGIASIPTNPLLTSDSRLNNLDATVSSRSTLTASQVWANGIRSLTTFGTLVSDIWASVSRSLTTTLPIILTAPFTDKGVIDLYKDTDYYEAENQAFIWDLSTLNLDLTGYTYEWDGAGVSIPGNVDSVDEQIVLEIPSTTIDDMQAKIGQTYKLYLIYPNEHRVLRARGILNIHQ